MHGDDLFLTESMMALEVREAHQEARSRVLAREVRSGQRSLHAGARRRLLQRLALLLVTWGGRLVRYGLPTYRPTMAKIPSGARLPGQ